MVAVHRPISLAALREVAAAKSARTAASLTTEEESVEELCTMLNVLQETEEEASLLWTALQSLLSSKEEIKEEMFAWLRALPRLYKIVPFCESFTCLTVNNCFQE